MIFAAKPGGALFEKTAPPGPLRKNFLLEFYPVLFHQGEKILTADF